MHTSTFDTFPRLNEERSRDCIFRLDYGEAEYMWNVFAAVATVALFDFQPYLSC